MPRVLFRAAAASTLALACLVNGGCLGTIAEAILAPEAIAMQGAAGSVQALTSGVSSQDLGSVWDAASTASDIDRIIAEHPEAANRPELEALRDRLNAHGGGKLQRRDPPREGSIADDPERRAEIDRRVEVPERAKSIASDALIFGPVSTRFRRPPDQPLPFAEPTPLDSWNPQPHLLDLRPVRVE